MKIIFTLLLVMNTCFIDGQNLKNKFSIDLIAGPQLAIPVGISAKNDRLKIKSTPGFQEGGIYSRPGINLGVVGHYNLTNELAFYSGFIYSQRGYTLKLKSSVSTDDSVGYYTGVFPSFYEYKLVTTKKSVDKVDHVHFDYLDVPLNIRMKSNNLYYFGGLTIAILVGDNFNSQSTEVTEVHDHKTGLRTSTTKNEPASGSIIYAKSALIGFNLGAGIDKGRLGFCARIVKTGKAFDLGIFGVGYPNLTIMTSLTYKIYPKKVKVVKEEDEEEEE